MDKIIYGNKFEVINLGGEKFLKINQDNFQKLDTEEIYTEEEMINKCLDKYNQKKYEII